LVVSNARQAREILQEVHSVRMIVGASLRARQWNQRFLSNIEIIPKQRLGKVLGRWGGFTMTPTAQLIDVSRIRERWWQLTWRVPDPSFGESD
jgi:hypothetical protein